MRSSYRSYLLARRGTTRSGRRGRHEAGRKLLADVDVSDISQRYRMANVLGSGAQATVYAAVSKKSQKKVAIKVLDAKELEDDELFEALLMEIRLQR